jgi:hypothetical protein
MREARREYNSEVETLTEIDDKALRMVRTATIVVGFAVSAVGIAGTSAISRLPLVHLIFTASGLGSMLFVVILGTGIATVTEYPSGVGERVRLTVERRNPQHRELELYIRQYREMTEEVVEEIRPTLTVLNLTHLALMLGAFLLFTGSSGFVLYAAYDVPPLVGLLPTPLLLLGLSLGASFNIRATGGSTDE